MSDVTRLLDAVERREPNAAEELLPLVYEELRRLAAHKMTAQPPGQTIQATALVHEVYLKLLGDGGPRWQNSRHFFAAAAEAMRCILIDRARRELRARRGGGVEKVSIENVEVTAPVKDELLVQMDEALSELADSAPELAEVVVAWSDHGNEFSSKRFHPFRSSGCGHSPDFGTLFWVLCIVSEVCQELIGTSFPALPIT